MTSADQASKLIAPLALHSPVQRTYWHNVLRRLMRDPVSMVCATILLLILLMAIFAPYVSPADPNTTSLVRRLRPIARRCDGSFQPSSPR